MPNRPFCSWLVAEKGIEPPAMCKAGFYLLMENESKYLSFEEIIDLPFIEPRLVEKECHVFEKVVYDPFGDAVGRTSSKFSCDVACLRYHFEDGDIPEIQDDGNSFEPTLWENFENEVFPPQFWTIKNLIPREGLVIISSASGEKKTWFSIEMGRCIVLGENFLGIEDFKTEKRNVLYLDQEMSKAEFQRRGKLLKLKSHGNFWLNRGLDNLDLGKPENVKKLYDFVKENNIGIVFIDTFRAVAGGLEEDKGEKVRKFFNLFKKFKDNGVVVIFLDHCRKPRPNEGKEPRKDQVISSQDKVASVDVLLMLKSKERSNEIFIYCRKNRGSIEYEPFKMEMNDIVDDQLNTIGVEFKYAGKFDAKELRVDEAKDAIIDLLESGIKTTPELIKAIYEEHHICEKNIRYGLKELLQDKLIQKIGKRGKADIFDLIKDTLSSNDLPSI